MLRFCCWGLRRGCFGGRGLYWSACWRGPWRKVGLDRRWCLWGLRSDILDTLIFCKAWFRRLWLAVLRRCRLFGLGSVKLRQRGVVGLGRRKHYRLCCWRAYRGRAIYKFVDSARELCGVACLGGTWGSRFGAWLGCCRSGFEWISSRRHSYCGQNRIITWCWCAGSSSRIDRGAVWHLLINCWRA